MTSVAREGGPEDVEPVADAVLDAFVRTFGYERRRPLAVADDALEAVG